MYLRDRIEKTLAGDQCDLKFEYMPDDSCFAIAEFLDVETDPSKIKKIVLPLLDQLPESLQDDNAAKPLLDGLWFYVQSQNSRSELILMILQNLF